MTSAPIQRPRQIPSLAGLRALAVLLVIALHTLLARNGSLHLPRVYYVLANGGLGVSIFFVLSGYLITALLLREHETTGRIALGSFYLRRIFRILPPLYVYLGSLLLLRVTGHLPGINTRELLVSLTFMSNYVPHPYLWATEHLWTICIEWQFYLLWPIVLLACLTRSPGTEGPRIATSLATRIAIAVIVAEPILRILAVLYQPHLHALSLLPTHADTLLFGALGALQQGHSRFERLYTRTTRWPWLPPLLLFGVSGTLSIRLHNSWNFTLGTTLDGFLILMGLLWLVRNPTSPAGRLFNHPPVTWIGRLSYSLYLWQTFYLHPQRITVWGHLAWWNSFPINWAFIFATGIFSYYCIEQPSLRLRDVFLKKIRWHEI